jgi:hypothetical protein
MKDAVKNTAIGLALFFAGALALAEPARSGGFANSLLNDVVQMTRAGLPDATIVAYVKARRTRLDSEVTAEDLIRLQRTGVSRAVVEYIAGAAGVSDETEVRAEVSAPDDRAIRAEPEDESVDVPYAYGWGYGYPYPYPYWYAYSPYFYGSFGIRGGGFFRHGRRFGHGSFGRGGHSFRGGRGGGRSGGHSSGGHGHH